MKRNAIIRIVLWSIVLVILLAMMFVLIYVPGAGRRMHSETPAAETAVAIPLVPSNKDISSGNAITTDNLNIRSAPDANAEVVAFAEKGTVLRILRQEQIGSKKWGYIGAPTLGWIDMKYVEMLEPVIEESASATEATVILDQGQYNAVVTSEGLNFRTMPSMESPTAGHVEKGDHLLITKQETVNEITWGYTPAPVNGWVVMKYVEPLEQTDAEITTMETTATQAPEVTGYAVALDAASIRELEIEWVAGSIRIQPKEITEIRITEEGKDQDKYPLVWKVRDSKLAIQYAEIKKNSTLIGISRSSISKDLIIEVPLDWTCDDLEIAAASATVEINDMNIREMEFDGASGKCSFNNCTVEKLDLDTASGDIQFSGSLQQLECDSASANILLELTNVPKSIGLDTASGDLEVTLPTDAGFTVTMDTLSSDFESDFATTKRNNSYVAGNGRCRIDVDAMSGDVIIRKNA